MINKVITILILIIFLFNISSCSHSPKKPISSNPREEISSSREISRSLNPHKEDPWWKKDENQWFFAVLIILGVGILTGASIWIASSSGGLYVNVRK
jgi:hypothetical protein